MIERILNIKIKITFDKTEIEMHNILIVKYNPAIQKVKINEKTNKRVSVMHSNIID